MNDHERYIVEKLLVRAEEVESAVRELDEARRGNPLPADVRERAGAAVLGMRALVDALLRVASDEGKPA